MVLKYLDILYQAQQNNLFKESYKISRRKRLESFCNNRSKAKVSQIFLQPETVIIAVSHG